MNNESMWQEVAGIRTPGQRNNGTSLSEIAVRPRANPAFIGPAAADPALEQLYQRMTAFELMKPEAMPVLRVTMRVRPVKCSRGHDMAAAKQNKSGFYWCKECSRITSNRNRLKLKRDEELGREAGAV